MTRISAYITVLVGMFLAGCTTILPSRPPLLSPFGDGTQWIVWEDIEFNVELDDKSSGTITVPKGFVTDLASTPKEIWQWYPPFGKYLAASILHDYLYWRQICTQVEADKILVQTMRDAKTTSADQARFFVALQAAGKEAIAENKRDKSQGLIRVLPPEYLDTRFSGRKPQATWKDLRQALKEANVVEPVQPSDATIPRLCGSLGREIKVKRDLWTLLFGR